MKADGFTLIELTIVIVIIGILIATGTAISINYLPVARDNERADDTASIARLLELSYGSSPGTEPGYPPMDTFIDDVTHKKGIALHADTDMFAGPGAGRPTVAEAVSVDSQEPTGAGSPVLNTYYYQALTADGQLCKAAGDTCASYKLIYRKESGGAVSVLRSARQQ